MKNQHTQGDWQIVMEEQDELLIAVEFEHSDTGYLYIATIHDVFNQERPETLANANLIAAAPELLAMCRRLYAWIGRIPNTNSEKEQTHYSQTIDLYHALLGKINEGVQP